MWVSILVLSSKSLLNVSWHVQHPAYVEILSIFKIYFVMYIFSENLLNLSSTGYASLNKANACFSSFDYLTFGFKTNNHLDQWENVLNVDVNFHSVMSGFFLYIFHQKILLLLSLNQMLILINLRKSLWIF